MLNNDYNIKCIKLVFNKSCIAEYKCENFVICIYIQPK